MVRLDELSMVLNSGSRTGDDTCDVVRLKGDKEKADAVYAGVEPLTAGDVAEAIVWAANRPPHVCIDEILGKPIEMKRYISKITLKLFNIIQSLLLTKL